MVNKWGAFNDYYPNHSKTTLLRVLENDANQNKLKLDTLKQEAKKVGLKINFKNDSNATKSVIQFFT